jgi:AbrB family looped-hinge helix DNA binding protein
MSSKGQVVIPFDMREDINDGDRLVVIRNGDQIIMKQADKLGKNFEEDIAFAKKTDEALKRIQSGKGVKMDFDEFIDDMKKW